MVGLEINILGLILIENLLLRFVEFLQKSEQKNTSNLKLPKGK